LVEDNPQLATAISAMIESFGPTVIHAHSAEEAFGILTEIQLVPDAFLVDFQLGTGLNGTDFYTEATRRYGPVPAAIISAERTKALRETCKTLDLPLIAKPIDKNRLRGLLVQLFRQNGVDVSVI
ncbi:MAG: response regulator, partial [Ascidiaceihabitans sp.]